MIDKKKGKVAKTKATLQQVKNGKPVGPVIDMDEVVEITNKETGELTQVHFFKFENVQYQMKDGQWYLTLTLQHYIRKLWMNYTMRWVVDLSKIEEHMTELMKARDDYQDSLLESEDEIVHNNFARREAEILEQKAIAIQEFEDIELEVGVEKMSRKTSGDTSITFRIPESAIDQLNKHRSDEDQYKVCLIRNNA